jgi:hypothetical protein
VQKVLMGQLVPPLSNQQQHRACADIERAMNDPLGSITADGHSNLLAAAAVTTIQRRGFGHQRLIQHQDHRA